MIRITTDPVSPKAMAHSARRYLGARGVPLSVKYPAGRQRLPVGWEPLRRRACRRPTSHRVELSVIGREFWDKKNILPEYRSAESKVRRTVCVSCGGELRRNSNVAANFGLDSEHNQQTIRPYGRLRRRRKCTSFDRAKSC